MQDVGRQRVDYQDAWTAVDIETQEPLAPVDGANIMHAGTHAETSEVAAQRSTMPKIGHGHDLEEIKRIRKLNMQKERDKEREASERSAIVESDHSEAIQRQPKALAKPSEETKIEDLDEIHFAASPRPVSTLMHGHDLEEVKRIRKLNMLKMQQESDNKRGAAERGVGVNTDSQPKTLRGQQEAAVRPSATAEFGDVDEALSAPSAEVNGDESAATPRPDLSKSHGHDLEEVKRIRKLNMQKLLERANEGSTRASPLELREVLL